jgi:MFS family permease
MLGGEPEGLGATLSFYGFMLGCLLLAAGTAVFKPGLQGTLAATMNKSEASLGWAIFYQLVNVGGFLGPVLAGVLRGIGWSWVFLSCTVIVALNYLWLPFYTSPTEEAKRDRGVSAEADEAHAAAMRENFGSLSRSLSKPVALGWTVFWTVVNVALSGAWWTGNVGLDVNNYALFTLMFGIFQLAFYVYLPLKERFDAGSEDLLTVIVVSTVGIFQLRVFTFALAFAGFWVMFNQVFDLLPNVIDDWVNSADVIGSLGAAFATPVAPAGLGGLLALILGGVSAGVTLLAMRPDRRSASEVPTPAFFVVGMGMAGALMPQVLTWAPSTGVAFVLLLGIAAAYGGLSLALRRHAYVQAGIVFVVGLLTWGQLAIGGMLDVAPTLTALAEAGEQVNPEWMLNINAGMIVFTMVFFGYLSGFVRPLTSIMIGMVVAIGGAVLAGTAATGWVCVLGIAVFSVGEMLSSPKKMEYLASLARKGQEALFMGYANVPVAIGWIAGSLFAGNRYEEVGDKVNLARKHLVEEVGMTPEAVEAIDKAEVMTTLAGKLSMEPLEVQRMLFDLYDPWWVWVEIGMIGLASLACMGVYDLAIRYVDRDAKAAA